MKPKLTYALAVFLALAAFLGLAAPSITSAQVSYNKAKGLISVKSEGRLLSEIMSEIGNLTGAEIYIEPSADRKVFAEFKDQPAGRAIKRLVKPLSYVVYYRGRSIRAVKVFEKLDGFPSDTSTGPSSGQKQTSEEAARKETAGRERFDAGMKERQELSRKRQEERAAQLKERGARRQGR